MFRIAMNSDFVVIDEIAPMELKSDKFIKAVEDALISGKNMLLVLHLKSNHPIVEKIRKEFDIFTVTPQNRDVIVSRIIEKII